MEKLKTEILIVEDSLTQAMILENFLENHNFQVSVANDGEKAMDWLSNNHPSLVISDIIMPGMNGYELCKNIKSNPQTQDIPVILLTSLSGTDEVVEGLISGADSFVTKPYDKEYLIAHIRKILSDKPHETAEKKSIGLEINFNGKKRIIQAEQQQMIKLLLNIYEGAIQQNNRLLQAQERLRFMNENLESLVEERTSEIEAKNSLLSALINSPGDIIIFSLNSQYCYTTFNENHRREMKKVWNADIKEGTNILECMTDPGLREMAKISLDRALSGEFFTEIQHQPGVDFHYEFSWNPIIQGNKTVGVTVFIMNITERIRKDRKIIESEHFLKTITSEVNEVIFSFDAQGIFTLSEGKSLRKLGLAPGQVVGMSAFDVYKDYPLIVQSMERALNGEVVKSESMQVAHLKFDTTFQPICDENGKVTSVVGLSIDVTDAKRAEEEIKHQNEELQKVNAEKDKFFSIIAHDLRSPISSFLGITELMVEDLPNMQLEDLQEMTISMKGAAENLYRLLENLLQWAKIQRGLIAYDPEISLLLPIINESLTMLNDGALKKEIKLNCNVPDGIEVIVDNNILHTVLRNLVSNAIKFTPKGGEISLSARIADARNIEVSVRDSGIGMTPEIMANLFEINNKSNRKGTEGEPSTGLGLILCKDFVEKLGGKIRVESEVGKGSVFHFTLPGNINPDELVDGTMSETIQPEVKTNRDLKILIAEDDEGSGVLLSLIVKAFGKNVIKVRTGVEAVAFCKKSPDIDLILTDVRMPEMDGYEAVKQIRQFNSEVIIIAQTAFAQTGEREIALEAGCNDYISKPIQKDKLIELIRKYFK